jgi:hypothetical protein
MNITFYKKRIKKLKIMLKDDKTKYSVRSIEKWINGCREKIKNLKKEKKKK